MRPVQARRAEVSAGSLPPATFRTETGVGRGRWPAIALGEDNPVHEVPSARLEPTLLPVPQSLPAVSSFPETDDEMARSWSS